MSMYCAACGRHLSPIPFGGYHHSGTPDWERKCGGRSIVPTPTQPAQSPQKVG
ncbi:MAG: hypothetical protein GX542_13160 [Rhodococcus sp.]|nr:hypothetical protein [Rhodococcus sp. (in: high G+C Gram-positive bacteria)]